MSGNMTLDPFERQLDNLFKSYADQAPAAVDAAALAHELAGRRARRGVRWLNVPRFGRLTPAYVLLVIGLIVALLALAVAGAALLRRERVPFGPGQNGTIVFTTTEVGDPTEVTKIHLAAQDGSDERVISAGDAADFSADGSTLLFRSRESSDHPILTVSNADGTNPKVITTEFLNGEAISPDGNQVIVTSPFVRFTLPQSIHTWITTVADGTTRDIDLSSDDSDSWFGNFVWSPDGQKIAFAEFRPLGVSTDGLHHTHYRTAYRSAVKLLDLSVSNPVVTTVSDRLGPGDPGLAWSPDGRMLAFTGIRDGVSMPTFEPDAADTPELPNQDIFVVDLSTGMETTVSQDDADELDPRWSPDGKKLAFLSRGDEQHIVVQDIAAGAPLGRPIVGLPADAYVWSPDGRSILLARTSEIPGLAGPDGVAVLSGTLQVVDATTFADPVTVFELEGQLTSAAWQWLAQ